MAAERGLQFRPENWAWLGQNDVLDGQAGSDLGFCVCLITV